MSMIPNSSITDHQRADFLTRLNKSQLVTSSWEEEFLVYFASAGGSVKWFTDGRRVATDKMRMKYGHEPEIKMPWPLAELKPVTGPEADPTGCQFLVAGEPCNAPAVWQRQNGFRYCQSCAENVERALKRMKKVIYLVKFP